MTSHRAVERCYHDAFIADQVLYLRSDVRLSLAHNERNTVTHNRYAPHVIGADGVPGSGDEGDIYWKIDRDLQSLRYSSKGGKVLPDFRIRYNTPLVIDTLTDDGWWTGPNNLVGNDSREYYHLHRSRNDRRRPAHAVSRNPV